MNAKRLVAPLGVILKKVRSYPAITDLVKGALQGDVDVVRDPVVGELTRDVGKVHLANGVRVHPSRHPDGDEARDPRDDIGVSR